MLFLCRFFPQLVQGPIGRYERLATQMFAEHKLEFSRIRYGVERIVWGLFKKMVIAEWAGIYREAIFADPEKYSGIAIFECCYIQPNCMEISPGELM